MKKPPKMTWHDLGILSSRFNITRWQFTRYVNLCSADGGGRGHIHTHNKCCYSCGVSLSPISLMMLSLNVVDSWILLVIFFSISVESTKRKKVVINHVQFQRPIFPSGKLQSSIPTYLLPLGRELLHVYDCRLQGAQNWLKPNMSLVIPGTFMSSFILPFSCTLA